MAQRLQEFYMNEIVSEFNKNYKNRHEIPCIKKVVVNNKITKKKK